ncbi:MAG: hypothetical protein ABFE13_00920 [Phycisphaerales bacterium]
MKPWDTTANGGTGGRFKTTPWSCILNAKTTNDTRRRLILNDLIESYWRPVYCYLRRKGFDNEAAKDLSQDFFTEIVLRRNLISHADQAKGRFRTFLLVALERYVVSSLRYWGRRIRGGQANTAHLDPCDLSNLDTLTSTPDPSQVFCFAWASQLLEQVLAELKEEYCSTQRASHWEIFQARVVAPIFAEAEAPSYGELLERYPMGTESALANVVVTVKRRFRVILMRHLRNLTGSEVAAEDEFLDIARILSGQAAQ